MTKLIVLIVVLDEVTGVWNDTILLLVHDRLERSILRVKTFVTVTLMVDTIELKKELKNLGKNPLDCWDWPLLLRPDILCIEGSIAVTGWKSIAWSIVQSWNIAKGVGSTLNFLNWWNRLMNQIDCRYYLNVLVGMNCNKGWWNQFGSWYNGSSIIRMMGSSTG